MTVPNLGALIVGLLAVPLIAATPLAQADTPDQQFLNLVHANGVGGQDDTLIAYAHEFCNGPGMTPSGPALLGQGVGPGGIYMVKVAASRIYCPDKIATPIGPPNVYHGGNL
jgi:hypothetical protein